MNRFLGLAGVVLQYATLASRALWLEVLFRRWNIRKLRDLPRLLVSSGCRAVARRARLSEQQAGHAARAMAVAIRLQLAVDTAFKEEVSSVTLYCCSDPCDKCHMMPVLTWQSHLHLPQHQQCVPLQQACWAVHWLMRWLI